MKFLNNLSPYGHWFLRIALASVFIFHGLDKFTKLSGLAQMMQMPVFMIVMVALFETGGGILVFVGGFTKDWVTRIGAVMIMPVMLGAISMVHWGQWAFMSTKTHPMGGMEFQFTILMIALYFLFKGNSGNPNYSDSA